jgi:hypothetical protein
VIGRGNLLTSISFPSQDGGILAAVMAAVCERNGADRESLPRRDEAQSPGPPC